MTFGAKMRSEFLLEDGIVFLNHGSYGATPRVVLAAQDTWRARMERQPVHFMQRVLPGALREAAGVLAGFLGVSGDDLVFVENATAGVNAVLRGAKLGPGDEVLTTDHAYPAIRNVLSFVCRESGAKLVEAPVPFPLSGDDQVVASVEAALSPRTRLAVFDHVTSETATVLPIAALAALCRSRSVPLLVDGAHAPGMLDLDIAAVGADWYVGNAHKWLFAPKGCGFLWAAPARQQGLHPTVVSHGLDQGFTAEFDWVGTRDPSAWLTVRDAIAFLDDLGPNGLGAAAVRAHNNDLAAEAATLLTAAWDSDAGAPAARRGAMATVRLPLSGSTPEAAARLHDCLIDEHAIEVPVLALGGSLWVRVSAQVYNEMEDYARLAQAVAKLN
jgi:isopenicillin-N epimerase